MKAFIFATGADTAGCAIRVAQAFGRRETPEQRAQTVGDWWRVRSMVATINYLDYPIDLPYSRQSLQESYDKADLVQMNSTMHGHDWYDRGQGKPTIIMHHGFHYGHFDKDIHGCVEEAAQIGATQVGSTVNLELLAPPGPPGPKSVTWTPTPYDLPALKAMRERLYEPKWHARPVSRQMVRIGHAPTDRAVKSTESVILAVKSLSERGFPVELVLIEHQTHEKTMFLKAKHVDLLVDQLNLGYGCNAIEAWALGIPVVGAVNAHPDWRAHMVNRFDLVESPTGLPFYEADERTLEKVLERLVTSRSMRAEWAAIGAAHVQRHHSEQSVVKLLTEIFNEAVTVPTKPSVVYKSFSGSQTQRLTELRRIRALQRIEATENQLTRAKLKT